MQKRAAALLAIGLVIGLGTATGGFAKDKKPTLPPYVLTAHTVAVIVDPQAGVSIDDPRANQVAQKDVETALLNWGRFLPILSNEGADLIIVVRKGTGRMVDQTIGDTRQNNRPGVINPTDNGVSVGGQHGPTPPYTSGQTRDTGQEPPHPRMEAGEPDDSFTVYEGGVKNPLDSPPVWRYVAKDGLHPHNVPAVDQFRKALDAADKAAAAAAAAKKP
jgi:hypothetical protein